MNYRQKIKIEDNNMEDIFKLPCISFISKNPQPLGPFFYLYPGMMHDYNEDLTHRFVARVGQWLCEDENGRWHIERGE